MTNAFSPVSFVPLRFLSWTPGSFELHFEYHFELSHALNQTYLPVSLTPHLPLRQKSRLRCIMPLFLQVTASSFSHCFDSRKMY